MNAAQTPATAEEKRVVRVRGAGSGRYAQAIEIGPHRLVADEPEKAGGGDAGPNPHEIALAGLGACTAITLRMYGEMKKLELRDVIVSLSYVRVDGTGPDGKPAKIDRVMREIELVGDLDDATRERLLQIAERCPVHRMMTGYATFETRLKS